MRKWWPLVAVCLGAFMLLVDTTIVTVALPKMATGLKTSFADLQWVVDAYALVLAALLMLVGSVADLIGRRVVYVAGLVLFAVASLACGLAPNATVLIASRAVQGLGGAAMFAASLALLNSTYHGRDRGTAFGVYGGINAAAAAAGPILGGLLTQHVSWRAIFLVNLPISVVTVIMVLAVFAETRVERGAHLDLPGSLAFTAAAGSLTYALIRAGSSGWGSAETIGLLVLAAVATAGFVLIEHRSAHPMLELALFRRRAFTGLMLGGLLLAAGAFSYILYTSLWLQAAIGLSPVETGLVLLPSSAAAFVTAALSGRLLHEVAPRLTIGIGMLLIAVGAAAQAFVTAGSHWTVLLPGLIIAGAGIGVSAPALASAAMATVPPARGGMAAGAMNTFRQLGFAFGIAILGLVFRTRIEDGLRGHVPDPHAAAGALSGGRIGGAGETPHLVHQVFASGLNGTYLLGAAIAAFGGVFVLVLVRGERTDTVPDREPVTAASESR
jgi:EmrB/QacA subfamily drug resistance transporter